MNTIFMQMATIQQLINRSTGFIPLDQKLM
jgi:hypothetical protein